jgi:hypothetical protein
MIERMNDTVGVLWAAVVTAGAACIRMFYSHGGRLSALEQESSDRRTDRKELREFMQEVRRDVGDIKVTLGIRGKHGRRNRNG